LTLLSDDRLVEAGKEGAEEGGDVDDGEKAVGIEEAVVDEAGGMVEVGFIAIASTSLLAPITVFRGLPVTAFKTYVPWDGKLT